MKRFSLLLLLILHIIPVKAQFFFYNEKYYDRDLLMETGLGLGGMNCLTDLGGRKGFGKDFIKDLNLKNTMFSGSIYIALNYKSMVALRLEGTTGKVVSYDSILKDFQPNDEDRYRYERNLSSHSNIFDVMLVAEVHPLFIGAAYEDPPRLSPYALGGVGFFSFNPRTKLNGQWHDLQPLHTEGQGFSEYPDRKPYKLLQINIPLGLGVKYEISPLFNARLEIIHRTLFTDYLDDVSTSYIDASLFSNYLPPSRAILAAQLHDRRGEIEPSHISRPGYERGDPKDNDSFFTIQLKIGFTMRERRK